MEISFLRQIGKRLLSEISFYADSPDRKTPIGLGAAGDKTFPVDKKAEEIIISGLSESGEPLTIISEEMGRTEIGGGGRRVIIDPVDGSKNAITGIPFYCSSIAVAEGDSIGDIKLSYIINLINGDEFWAEKNKGAFLNGMQINTQKDEEFYLIAYEAPVPGRDIPEIIPLLSKARRTRCLGATALDLAYLSSGAISVFITPSPSRSFDFAGGWLLVKEAGGIITDTSGGGIDNIKLDLKKSVSLLASGNRNLHIKALELLSIKS